MKIKTSDRTKIDAVLDRVNGKAVAHTYNARNVANLACWAEETLEQRGVLKKHRKGAVLQASGVGASAKAYKWEIITTAVTLLRGNSEWFLCEAERDIARPINPGVKKLLISPLAAKDICNHSFADIKIRQGGHDLSVEIR